MKAHLLNIDNLKKDYLSISYFGLGWIQLKLTQNTRLHFYTNLLPKTADSEELHNHRYSFSSKILKGKFVQELWDVQSDPLGDWIMSRESCNPNIIIDPCSERVSLEKVFEKSYHRNDSYFIDYRTFHKVSADEGTITFLERTLYKSEWAQVIHHKDKVLTCPHSITLPESKLWELVDNIIKI
jgi:hypothetical protein